MKRSFLLVVLPGLLALTSLTHAGEWEDAIREMKRFRGTSVKGVDTSTLKGKIVCGYQGWFGTPNDGYTSSFTHYANKGKFRPGFCSIDYWPHTAEFPKEALAKTPWKKKDGSTAMVFTSAHPAVVLTHFKWMQQYGIEAAFLQRFVRPSTTNPGIFRKNNRVLDNVRAAANATGRAYVVMYDGVPSSMEMADRLITDWKRLVDHMGITRDPADKAYLKHRGKPLVALWGPGFKSRNPDLKATMKVVKFFKNDPRYGGLTVMLGVPSRFRALERDSVSDPYLHEVIKAADMASPWAAGRYSMQGVDAWTRGYSKPDLAWCNKRGVDYLPCVYPGFSWANLHQDPKKSDARPRYGGHFLWKQFANLIEIGVEHIYVGMFDEIDEGTHILKVDNNPPVTDKDIFLSHHPQPEDHYLWITGTAQKMLRKEIPFSKKMPKRKGYPYPAME